MSFTRVKFVVNFSFLVAILVFILSGLANAVEVKEERSKKIDQILDYLGQQTDRYVAIKDGITKTLAKADEKNKKILCKVVTQSSPKDSFSDIKQKAKMLEAVKGEMNQEQLEKFNPLYAIASEIDLENPYLCNFE